MGYLEPLLWDNDDKNDTFVVDKDKATGITMTKTIPL